MVLKFLIDLFLETDGTKMGASQAKALAGMFQKLAIMFPMGGNMAKSVMLGGEISPKNH